MGEIQSYSGKPHKWVENEFTIYCALLMPQKDWQSSFKHVVIFCAIPVSPFMFLFHVYNYIMFSSVANMICCCRVFFSLVLESQYARKMKYVCIRTLPTPEVQLES